MAPEWSTSHTAFAYWVVELPAAAAHDPRQRATFVERVLAAGVETGVYALGDATGPREGAVASWLRQLQTAAATAAWFPGGGPLGLSADALRPWARLHVDAGSEARWCSDLGALFEQLAAGGRATHVFPVHLGGPAAADEHVELSVALRTDLWFPKVLWVDPEDREDDRWVDRGAGGRDDAARFGRFLEAVRAAAEDAGGGVALDESEGNRRYAHLVDEDGPRLG
jgi:hypothetical protein